jgi:hypothetical protein
MIAVVLGTLAGAGRALGQATNTGTVVGEITDPSGALIAGATVTITDASEGFKLTAVTNAAGKYAFTTVPPGTYSVSASKSGFSISKTDGQEVSIGTQLTINLSLKVGGGAETVEVQVVGTELQTLNSTVGQNLTEEQLSSLPSLNHDANTFTVLQPGVSVEGSVAGAVNDQSTFILDGGNATNDMDGGNNVYMGTFAGDPTEGAAGAKSGVSVPTGAMPTPTDSVQEATINTANQTADFNNSAGAQVEFVTPRGTNRWHGGAYEYYLDSGLGANSWNNNQTATPIANYHYSRFGAKAGGVILPNKLGGRTYLWGWFEGLRFPNAQTIEATVPSANMEAGILSYGGTSYDMKTLDPRGIGINPDVQAMWTKYEPAGNDATCASNPGPYCDGVNTLGFKANITLPQSSNNAAVRIDHDFGSKWHWFASYRYYYLQLTTDSQYDIGGFFSGDTKGTPAALSSRPQIPSYYVTGLTTTLSANTTNDFHYSYLRDYWQWGDKNAPAQIAGLGGALEPGGETQLNVLAPFNVNAQDIRTRFWDGQDNFLSDNVSTLKGNHLIQWGGQYQHNYDYHQRSDNGGGINFTTTYQLGDSIGGGQIDFSSLGGPWAASSTAQWAARNAAEVYGVVTDSQTLYTRAGSTLALQPPLTHAFDQQTIDFYNAYVSDTWKLKPSLTLNYGLGYTIEMPPSEKNGKSTVLVNDADEPVKSADYLAERKAQAEQGNVFNPQLGFALVGNVGQGEKYPYNPFYGSFSPRIGLAWNPGFSKGTVVRGGYGRIYGRLNGVDLVLVPLLGVGLMQPVQCKQAFMNGVCGPTNPTVSNAFRIGVDGNSAPLAAAAPTAPQPIFPGVNFAEGSANEGMDPSFRPNVVDSFDLTIQHQIGQKMILEVGYIGRLIHHEYQPVNLNAVPYMMSVGGQQFQNAYANLEKALGCATSAAACGANVPSPTLTGGAANPAYASYINSVAKQPFFEAAMAGTGACTGMMSNGSGTPYANCTAAVLDTQLSNLETQAVWSLWSALDNGGFIFKPTMLNNTGEYSSGVALNAATGYGNYNGGFVSFGVHNWHGLTMQNNFTWSKALGTGAVVQASSEYTQNDAYNLGAMYGEQNFDRRLVYNTAMIASDPWFKSQSGLLGRVAGGWMFAPIFTIGTGGPVYCNTFTDGQSFGAGDAANYYDNEQCVFNSQYNAGHSAHFGVTGDATSGVGTATSTTPVNMFSNPLSVYNQVRAPILGIDTKNPGQGPFMGLPYWNVDAQVKKNFRIAESTSFEFSFTASNIFNHTVFSDPYLSLGYSPAWGVLNTQQGSGNTPSSSREMEFGGRIAF